MSDDEYEFVRLKQAPGSGTAKPMVEMVELDPIGPARWRLGNYKLGHLSRHDAHHTVNRQGSAGISVSIADSTLR